MRRIFLIVLLSAGLFLPELRAQGDSVMTLKQCVDCHRDADSQVFRARMIKDCTTCHAARNGSKSGLQSVAKKIRSSRIKIIAATCIRQRRHDAAALLCQNAHR